MRAFEENDSGINAVSAFMRMMLMNKRLSLCLNKMLHFITDERGNHERPAYMQTCSRTSAFDSALDGGGRFSSGSNKPSSVPGARVNANQNQGAAVRMSHVAGGPR